MQNAELSSPVSSSSGVALARGGGAKDLGRDEKALKNKTHLDGWVLSCATGTMVSLGALRTPYVIPDSAIVPLASYTFC